MAKVNQKMKKFNPLRMLDGLRSSVSNPPRADINEIEETLRSDDFQVARTVRHGFPFQPTAMAYDPVQNLLAIGTRSGSLRIFGRPGVDCHVSHDRDVAVIQLLFLVNEGALVSVCSDEQLHLWNLRQKKPEIVHSLKFQRERITYCHLPFQSKWLYIGTERGNVHIVNIESFVLSGYVINWNKAIELSRKTHPGPVVHLSDNPVDSSKLLIGFESGAIVLWDLRNKTAELRFNCTEALRCICWHHEGKQFVVSHSDGSISTWNIKNHQKAISIIMPHAKIGKDGKPDPCKPVIKVEWRTVRNGEPYVIFSGGMPYDKASRTPSLTVMHAKNTTVLEMEHNVVDFLTLCTTPWKNDFQDPYGIVVLLQNDLVVVDLTSPGYPCFENPYPMDIHESPVTACSYYAVCPPDLIPAFYSVGSKQKRTGFSEKDWPVKGGVWGKTACSYPEIILTGHADGSIKFWDASAVTLQVLYKLKTAKVFDKAKCKSSDPEDDPFAIEHMNLCLDSRLLCVAGSSHVILFRFCKQESTFDPPVLDISIVYEICDELDSPEFEYPPNPTKPSLSTVSQQSDSVGSYSSTASDGKDCVTSVRVKSGARKWPPGYQPDLCCLLTWIDNEPPPVITSVSVNSRYGLLAFGNEYGLAIVDIIQKACLLNMGTPDLYGSMDPYSRAPRSPKSKYQPRPQAMDSLIQPVNQEEVKSPTTEQSVSTTAPSLSSPSPTSQKWVPQGPGLTSIDECSDTAKEKSILAERQGSPSVCVQSADSGAVSLLPAEPPPLDLVDVATEVTEDSTMDSPSVDGQESTFVGHIEEVTKGNESQKKIKEDPVLIIKPVMKKTKSDLSIQPKKPLKATKSLPVHAINREFIVPSTQKSKTPDSTTPKLLMETVVLSNDTKSPNEKNEPLEICDTPVASPRKRKSLFHGFKGKKSEKYGSEAEGLGKSDEITSSCVVPSEIISDNIDEEESQCVAEVQEDALHEPPLSAPPIPNRKGFVRRMSQKIKTSVKGWKTGDDDGVDGEVQPRLRKRLEDTFHVVDLTHEDVTWTPPLRKLNYLAHLNFDKNDGSFSRSRSSSMSSLENISKEAIQCLAFADSYTRKTDNYTCPCLWVGTSLGSVLVIVLNLPSEGEQRKTQPVIVSPSGTIFRLKGAIRAMSFLDCNGVLIPAISDTWRDVITAVKEEKERKYNRQQSVSSMKSRMSPTTSTEQPCDRQFAIICSERQARVVSLPSQTCAYKVKITETSFVTKARVVSMKGEPQKGQTLRDSVFLACYVANGHIMTFSLPSLKPLHDVDYLPQADIRTAKTFNFSNNGHALYFCSPTEVQKLTLSADICDNLNEMLGDLFLPCDTPEAPKQSFFKNLFGGGTSALDREELFGESSGKASKGVAAYTPGSGMAQAQDRSREAVSEIAKARMAAVERGEKLGEVEEATEKMLSEAEQYARNAHNVMLKYRDKKWYQF